MMLEFLITIVPNILLAGSLVGLGVFAFTYARNSNWRSTGPGRALMYLIFSMGIVLVMSFAHLITGPYPGIEFVRIAVYGGMTFAIWKLVWSLYRELKIVPSAFLRLFKHIKKPK